MSNNYYGPKTSNEAIVRIEYLIANKIELKYAVAHIVKRMIDAGFKKETVRVKKYFKR